MSKKSYLFTSESVSEGHPDKVCDRISDMVVDTYLSKEPFSFRNSFQFLEVHQKIKTLL